MKRCFYYSVVVSLLVFITAFPAFSQMADSLLPTVAGMGTETRMNKATKKSGSQIVNVENHLSLIYDFIGNDFDYAPTGLAATRDSLYVTCMTPDLRGKFFRIDHNGKGYKEIWNFDNLNFEPLSLIGNESVIYGSTRYGQGLSGGSIFRYSIKDHNFRFIKVFSPDDVQGVFLRQITDGVLWFLSGYPESDLGSISTINQDGSDFKKQFSDFDYEKGCIPSDFALKNDSIYISCFGGGGWHAGENNQNYYFGSFIRVPLNGTGYKKIVNGDPEIGSDPAAILIRKNKMYGLFSANASINNGLGTFFRCNLGGTSFEQIGNLRGRTKLLSIDSLIYIAGSVEIFGFNPYTDELRILENYTDNPDFGYDVCVRPVTANGNIFLAENQGGPNGGGTILKWTNKPPKCQQRQRKSMTIADINLYELFSDPDGDSLTYSYTYDKDKVTLSESKGILTITPLQEQEVYLKIVASDGWGGHGSYVIEEQSIITGIKNEYSEEDIEIYPNPAISVLNFSTMPDVAEIYTLNGVLLKSLKNPDGPIEVSSLDRGIYLTKLTKNGKIYYRKFIKI